MRRGVSLFLLVAFAVCAPSASAAKFEIPPGGFAVRALDSGGQPETRSGAHPDRFQIDFAVDAEGTAVKDLAFEMPAGFGGSTESVPLCSRQLYEEGEEECPPESQVGEATFALGGGETTLPIFQLEPKPDEVVAFGSDPDLEVSFGMELRPGDLGLTLEATDLPEASSEGGRIELWGVPADHQVGTSIPRRPFLTLPTRCGPLDFAFRARSSEPEADWIGATAQTEPLTGCESLAFAPRLAVSLTAPRADAASGARIELLNEEEEDPDGLAGAQIKDATIALPDGLTVSPGGAAGATACSDAQLGLDDSRPPACPPSSRVGTVEVETPALPEPLTGGVYLGQERPGQRFRLLVAASAGQDAVAKFVSTLVADPATGRLSARLVDLPPIPLRRMSLAFDGGQRAMLATPIACGTYRSLATFVSQGGATVASTAPVTIGRGADGGPCPAAVPFSPTVELVVANSRAGRATALTLTLRRRPGEQLARRFVTSLPPGLSTGLGAVELCPDEAARSGACPPASRAGTALAEAGSGDSPLALSGAAYLAGPYRGSPFSIVLALKATIGPFDLGTTTTRAAIRIDSRTARATVVTDPLPALVEGVPIRLRTIRLSLDRPGLVRNPTSCSPSSFDASVEAAGGAVASLSSPFAVRGCRRLGFAPRFSLALTGRSQLHEGGKPGMRLSARMRPHDAGLRGLRFAMPRAFKLRLSGVAELCPRRDARAGLCTAQAQVGVATMRTSLLDKPLQGAVYMVQPLDDGLPDLWVGVAAEGLHLGLATHLEFEDGRLTALLGGLPDMPLSEFSLRLRGGGRGALSLGVDPCGERGRRLLRSPLRARGQNGARRALRLQARAPCGDGAA